MSNSSTFVITAKFAGKCARCKGPIAEGEKINYTKSTETSKSRSEHLECPAVPATPMEKAIEETLPQPERLIDRMGPGGLRLREAALARGWTSPADVYRAAANRYRQVALSSDDDATRARIVRMADAEFRGFFGIAQPPARVIPEGFPERRDGQGHYVPQEPMEPTPVAIHPDFRPSDYDPDCVVCQRGGPGPSHSGSRLCRSGSPASGGRHAHCSCDTCY